MFHKQNFQTKFSLKLMGGAVLLATIVFMAVSAIYSMAIYSYCRNCISSNDLNSLKTAIDRHPKMAAKMLPYAYQEKNRAAFVLLLKSGTNPNGIRLGRLTFVHRAARNPDIFWLEQLLNYHADPNYHKVIRGIYPMMEAIEANNPENVRLLIKFGADVNVTTERNESMLTFAWGQRRGEIVMILLDSGALINPPSPRYESFVELIQIIAEDGITLNPREVRDEEFLKQARQRFREQDLDLKNATWDESQGNFGVWKIPSFSGPSK